MHTFPALLAPHACLPHLICGPPASCLQIVLKGVQLERADGAVSTYRFLGCSQGQLKSRSAYLMEASSYDQVKATLAHFGNFEGACTRVWATQTGADWAL